MTVVPNTPELWLHALAEQGPYAHKYQHGSVLVWSGPPLATGASRLAASAALRAGSGLATLAGEHAALLVHAAHVTSVMLRAADGHEGLAELLKDKRYTAVVLGPAVGICPETRELVATTMTAGRACVLDADALTSFAGRAQELANLIKKNPQPIVLTPHSGEFLRLTGGEPLPDEPEDSQGERRISQARDAARLFQSTLVLKGARTVIAAADGRVAVNENAPPWLATAGSGDVLSGIIGGLLAQGIAGFEAACAGVWLHGLAGQIAGRGMIADDLVLAVSNAVAKFYSPPA